MRVARGAEGGFTGRIAWRSNLMWKMSLRETTNGVKREGGDLRAINI